MNKLHAALVALSLALASGTIPDIAFAQTPRAFQETTDSLTVLLSQRTSVLDTPLKIKRIVRRGTLLDFHFDNTLGDYPWRADDIPWFRDQFESLFPDAYKSCELGRIFSKKTELKDLVTPELSFDGKSTPYRFRYQDRDLSQRFIRREGEMDFPKGMSGRNISLWQSHGLYYDADTDSWKWQRAPLFRTVEDMYTQSYVLPFLIPMLENAGAYVMTPRERDTHSFEVVCDNDPSFTQPRVGGLRRRGEYSENGVWSCAGEGFADPQPVYFTDENPFLMGSARKAAVSCDGRGTASAEWSFEVEERGRYAVYISYKTLENSTTAAHYRVNHLGGASDFTVNQTMGGSTWIYLGSFDFAPGRKASVTLDNIGEAHSAGKMVTADAVRIGGGMGKMARGQEGSPKSEWTVSGMPAFAEGALYSMQWAGVDTCIFHMWDNEYTRDYASRGAWTSMMSYGSVMNPLRSDKDAPTYQGRRIPIDMSLAFHSDAGVTPNDSIIGTLAIYSLMCDGADTLPDGRNRAVGRTYADFVQTQLTRDLRALVDTSWNRRCIWDRSYSESRTSGTPGMLLELLSHQNFADMRLGLDPEFRFTACRAVYKGMLKFLSELYGHQYVVQPLPVRSMSATFGKDRKSAVISWEPTEDALEPTATPRGYILYTRVDDGAFDSGRTVREFTGLNGKVNFNVDISPGHIYSFKVEAYNEGGRSFPSEILSIGAPGISEAQTVMIVNNFDRISAPAWFDTPEYAGFLGNLDSGVGYINDIWYVGEDYQHRRDLEWITNDNPGFGATRTDKAGSIVAGNSFDYPYVHGKALMAAGFPFYSVSRDAWVTDNSLAENAFAADIICGKQVTVKKSKGGAPDKYKVFPASLQSAIRAFTQNGGNLIVSGANIATDVWDKVYPITKDKEVEDSDCQFVTQVLGYSWGSSFGSDTGRIIRDKKSSILNVPDIDGCLSIWNTKNPDVYCVENPDGLKPYGKKSTSLLRYEDSGICAAVLFSADNYRAISFGFPLETIKNQHDIQGILESTLRCFKR